MDIEKIREYILERFEGTAVIEDEGNRFFVVDRENNIPFVTIVGSNKYDNYSDLDRPDVYRLNVGIGKDRYRSMFPVDKVPTEGGYDFAALDVIMPHPEYGRVYWICVLNPSEATFAELETMLAEAFAIAVRKYNTAQAARGAAR